MSLAIQQKNEIKIKLSVVQGPHKGQIFQLNKANISIGRGPENDVVLMNDPQVSRQHAKVIVVDRDLEVINTSQKNSIIIQGESVQKWKIINHSTFKIGDTEFSVEYDLGLPPAPTVLAKKPADVVALRPKNTALTVPPKKAVIKPQVTSMQALQQPRKPNSAAVQNFNQPRPQQAPMQNRHFTSTAQMGHKPNANLMDNPKFKFYMVAVIIICGVYFYLDSLNKKGQAKKITSTLKYADEVNIKLNSKKQSEIDTDRTERKKQKDASPQQFRIEENFVKGMRDFQLGNYLRAQEFFQLVLNLDPDHQLAKRHLYLCKVRFDELLQEKLVLGESYFKKHNFAMCESMYRQVMNMLEGKSNDQKYKLAEKKSKECELAQEGIR